MATPSLARGGHRTPCEASASQGYASEMQRGACIQRGAIKNVAALSLSAAHKTAHLVEMVDTTDLKSVPTVGYRFKSDSEHFSSVSRDTVALKSFNLQRDCNRFEIPCKLDRKNTTFLFAFANANRRSETGKCNLYFFIGFSTDQQQTFYILLRFQ